MKRHTRIFVPYPPRPGGIACLGYLYEDPGAVIAVLQGASIWRTDGGVGEYAWTDLYVSAPPQAGRETIVRWKEPAVPWKEPSR